MTFQELLQKDEQALPIEGYANYVVTNQGRVISLKGHPKLLKPQTNSGGYQFVDLCINGKTKHYLIHRLVAAAFIPNPDNLPEVNHRDEVKTNNHVSNLEWCTSKYNVNYSQSKPVGQYTKNGELIKIWSSIMEAERSGGFNNGNIVNCLKGRYASHGGFLWRYTKNIKK